MAQIKVGQVYGPDAGAPASVAGIRRTVTRVDGDAITYTAVDKFFSGGTTFTRTLTAEEFLRGSRLISDTSAIN